MVLLYFVPNSAVYERPRGAHLILEADEGAITKLEVFRDLLRSRDPTSSGRR